VCSTDRDSGIGCGEGYYGVKKPKGAGLLGVDVGTTGCKAGVFSEEGRLLSLAYAEYDVKHPKPGWAELNSHEVWASVKRTIAQAVSTSSVSVTALAVSSLGEALVPVSAEREVLGPSILNFDTRGEEYLAELSEALPDTRLYQINGNSLGNHYSLTKLLWLKDHEPTLYERADKFLPWGSFVGYMLGAEPVVDLSLANRTLLLDLDRQDWSDEVLSLAGIGRDKLPRVVPSGTPIGRISSSLAKELGLPKKAVIVSGAHDQCANAVGCGVLDEGRAMYGMGTYLCITPVFRERKETHLMMERGLSTEHHVLPDRFVTFLYNHGGSLVKWFRDTFAKEEHRRAQIVGRDIYEELFLELPKGPSGLLVLPHFATTGPPEFVGDSSGVIMGLRLDTSRGAILKAILEGATFYLRECLEALAPTGIRVEELRAVGGGSKSDYWVQLSADIFGLPLVRPEITEAGVLGAAILAGVGCGTFDSVEEGVAAMVRLERLFEPDSRQASAYEPWFARYREMWPLMRDFLRRLV